MPFVKGQSGNPSGRPKVNPEIKALLDEMTPEAIRTLGAIMRDTEAQPSARVTAALGILRKTLPDMASVEHSGEVTIPTVMRAPMPANNADEWQSKHVPLTLQ